MDEVGVRWWTLVVHIVLVAFLSLEVENGGF